MAKKQIVTPKGENVIVRRRAWPWPNITTKSRLEEIGMSGPAATWLGQEPRGDLAITGLIALPFLLTLAIGAFTVFIILAAILTVMLLVFYLALPWAIEVVHEGEVVESEEVAGSVKAKNRVAGVADLYESGAVRLPTPPSSVEPERKSSLPVPGRLPDLKDRNLDFRPTLGSMRPEREPSLPGPSGEPELPSPFADEPELELPSPTLPEPALAPPPRPTRSVVPDETPLRRAIRLAEEEEARYRGLEAAVNLVDRKQARRARPKKSKPSK